MWLITPHGAHHPAPAPLPTQLQPEGCQRTSLRRHPLYLLRAGSGTGWGRMEWEQGPWQHRLRPQGMGNPGGQGSGICTPGRESLKTEHTYRRRSRQAQRILTCITEMEKHHRARRAELRRWGANQWAGCGISWRGGTKEQGRGQRSSRREQEGGDSINRGKAPDPRERENPDEGTAAWLERKEKGPQTG